jgi:toxin ParE1/3/4
VTGQRCRIEFAKSARDDLRDITEWYSAQQVPDVGKRLVAEIVARVEQLTIFPDSGRVVPEFETPWLREVQLPPFRIVYRRDDDFVTVVRVWRSERLMDHTLGKSAEQALQPDSAPTAADSAGKA